MKILIKEYLIRFNRPKAVKNVSISIYSILDERA